MSGTSRSGRIRYAYPAYVGDAVYHRIENPSEYHRLRYASYKRAGRRGHRIRCHLMKSTLRVERIQ